MLSSALEAGNLILLRAYCTNTVSSYGKQGEDLERRCVYPAAEFASLKEVA